MALSKISPHLIYSDGRAEARQQARRPDPTSALVEDAKVFLEYEGDGASQARPAVFMSGDQPRRAASREDLALHFGFDDGTEAMP